MHKLTTMAAAAALATLTTTPAWSLTLEFQLSPKGLSANERTFTVTTKQMGEFTEFDVTVTPDPKGRSLSPFVRGDLSLDTPDEKVALVRLEPKREGGKVSYWFRVSRKAMEGSRFEIGEQAYGVRSDGDHPSARDERGEQAGSRELAGRVEAWEQGRHKAIALLIGGAEGHAETLRAEADWLWSLGKLTLQHEMALVLVLEQVYRAYTIKAGLPYHRE